jgi:hypothetical protein
MGRTRRGDAAGRAKASYEMVPWEVKRVMTVDSTVVEESSNMAAAAEAEAEEEEDPRYTMLKVVFLPGGTVALGKAVQWKEEPGSEATEWSTRSRRGLALTMVTRAVCGWQTGRSPNSRNGGNRDGGAPR